MWITSSQVSSPSAASPVPVLIRICFYTQSVIMSLGSPSLAAYSLALTSLNNRSVYRRAKSIKHKSKGSVARALVSLQQIPLELTKDERLLASVLTNDRWRQGFAGRLGRKDPWSLAKATPIAWACITFLFALINSFITLNNTDSNIYGDHSVGTLWLWLLCLVISWQWHPVFSSSELKTALNYANCQAVKGTTADLRETKEATGGAMGSAKTKLVNKVPKRPENQGNHGYAGQAPDWNANLSANPDANQSVTNIARSARPSINPEFLIPQKLTSLNRDQCRLSVTFNYSRIMRYLVLVDDVFRALDRFAGEKDEVGLSGKRLTQVVSLIFDRRGPPPAPFSFCLRRGLCSLREHSPRYSKRQSWPSFSSAERPLQPQSSQYSHLRSGWGVVLWDTPSTEGLLLLSCSSPSSRQSSPASRKPAKRDPPSPKALLLSSPSPSVGSPACSR
jgi:hypothetical protein